MVNLLEGLYVVTALAGGLTLWLSRTRARSGPGGRRRALAAGAVTGALALCTSALYVTTGPSAPSSPVVHVAQAAALDLPPVPNAPARFQVVAYGAEPGSGPELGVCALRLRDPEAMIDWFLDGAQTWEIPELRGDTTFVRHVTIGDYVPADRGHYGMDSSHVARVDCAAYGLLGLASVGG